MFQTGFAGLAFHLERSIEFNFGIQVAIFEGGESFRMMGMSIFLLLMIP